jgi:hypothetical protein
MWVVIFGISDFAKQFHYYLSLCEENKVAQYCDNQL